MPRQLKSARAQIGTLLANWTLPRMEARNNGTTSSLVGRGGIDIIGAPPHSLR